tara:strand:+ start:223 stop:534 length:312 start_codon:yes stop_codon:yes gene_type:complete
MVQNGNSQMVTGVTPTASLAMSFQSGLLGSAVTVMGALSLSTPELMQIHEVQADRVSVEPKSVLFNEELFRSASSDSSRICRDKSAERVRRATPAWAAVHQFS